MNMNIAQHLPSLTLSMLCLLSLSTSAQILDVDGGVTVNVTTTIDNSSNNLFLGTNSSGNILDIISGGILTNAAQIGIGEAGNLYNTLLVSDPGSAESAVSIRVGDASSLNLLTISNGGVIFCSNMWVGNGAGSSAAPLISPTNFPASSNSVVITGSGSAWYSTGGLLVGTGTNAAFNTLIISNGGVLTNGNTCNIGQSAGASNNSALITGAHSLWVANTPSVNGDLFLSGTYSSLTVSNGGALVSYYLINGQQSGPTSNKVIVTGSGSVVTNAGTTYVGANGGLNTMIISNGGLVYTGNTASVGNGANSSNNAALITDSGSFWQAAGNFFVGYNGSSNQVTVSNGGTLFVGTNTVIGNTANAGHNSMLVTGANSLWKASGNITMGGASNCSFNQLVISKGATVTNAGVAYIGNNSYARSNSVLVTDPNSLWTMPQSGSSYIWMSAPYSTLTVSNGATVSGVQLVNGQVVNAPDSVVVTGTGSFLTNSGITYVGATGASNSMTISAGGKVGSGSGPIGNNVNASNNTVLITGANSLWQIANGLQVGAIGAFNRMTINQGGAVSAGGVSYVGNQSNSSNNYLLISDAGSMLTDANDFYVGANTGANYNQVVITNGGILSDLDGRIGGGINANSNSVLVTGAGSTWQNTATFWLANDGSSNTLTISNGGLVSVVNPNNTSFVGAGSNAAYNTLTVTGTGSTLSLGGGPFTVGNRVTSRNNVLNVGNGGLVANAATLTLGGVNSTFNLGDGAAASTLSVNNINLSTASARMNVNNGVISLTGNGFIQGPGTLSISSGGATLDTEGNSVLFYSSVGGVGALTQTGSGYVVMTGTNTYTGGTFLNGGTLDVYTSGSLQGNATVAGGAVLELDNAGALATNALLNVASGGTVILSYSGTDTIGALSVGGVAQPSGTYGAGASNPGGVFSGGGTLTIPGQVSYPAPGFTTVSLNGTTLTISATNGLANGTYYVLASTNVALPLLQWNVIFTNAFDSSGNIVNQQVPVIDPGNNQKFFILLQSNNVAGFYQTR